MDESSTNQNRRSRRTNVFLAATIETAGQVVAVKLRNLSESGALIEADKLPVEGSELLFRRNDLAVQSRVAWVQGKHAGLAFAEALDAQTVLRHVPTPKPKSAAASRRDFRRPGLAHRELTPEEKMLAKYWALPPAGVLDS